MIPLAVEAMVMLRSALISDPVSIFLVVLLIILVAPIIFNRLKIPHIIGLILSGLTVGPYGFNLLARDMSFEVFGQVGILYLMFLAGLEIDMLNLKRNLKRGVVFGAFTFGVPLIVGTVASVWLLHLSMLTALLVASMFCAHTLIAYPIVSRFGLTKSPAVVIAVTGTIFTVLGSLIVLASVTGVYRDGAFDVVRILRIFGGLALWCVIVVFVLPRLTRWFFKSYSDGILQFVYVLSMAFLAAHTVTWAGVESVFGAFFAGLVLSRYIPARSRLMTRLEFVGNAIFIPYFLIGVGMLINLRVLAADENSLYTAIVMSLIAMSTKWGAAWLTQKTFGMDGLDRSMMYQLTNAHTAVALAVVTIGFKMGIFGETILNGTILMILITCTVSSIGTSRAAARMKTRQLEEAETMPGYDTDRKTSTLISIANPMSAVELVDLALLMRRSPDDPESGEQGPIYALHVRSDNSAISRSVGRNSLAEAEKAAAAVDVKLESIERFDLNYVTGLINTVSERDITRLFIGLHRRTTVIDSFFGDKVEQLLKATNRMVVISRAVIPVNTVTRVVVAVPPKAEYETGFRCWVEAVANLTTQVGCRIIFCCTHSSQACIRAVLRRGRYQIRHEYRDIDRWDDIVLLANRVLEDDLFVVVNARRTSVSFDNDMDGISTFLQKYFAGTNIVVIYPEQFGEESDVPTSAEMLSTDISSTPSAIWLRAMSVYRTLTQLKKRYTHRHRRRRLDL